MDNNVIESAEKGVEKASKLTIKLIKWLLGIVVLIIFLASIFYMLFYSPIFANFSQVPPMRRWYQETVWKISAMITGKGRFNDSLIPTYTIRAESPRNGINRYVFWGTFDSFTDDGKTLIARGLDGKKYVFDLGEHYTLFTPNPATDPNDYINPTVSYRGKDVKQYIHIDNTGYSSNSQLNINWYDPRTLQQVLKNYSENSFAPLNNLGPIYSFTKYN